MQQDAKETPEQRHDRLWQSFLSKCRKAVLTGKGERVHGAIRVELTQKDGLICKVEVCQGQEEF